MLTVEMEVTEHQMPTSLKDVMLKAIGIVADYAFHGAIEKCPGCGLYIAATLHATAIDTGGKYEGPADKHDSSYSIPV
jgi:hypothetical protein